MWSIILAGGGGTRLHPLSTEENPKQFLRIYSSRSLLQETALRLAPFSDNILVVSNKRYAKSIEEHMKETELDNWHVVYEPEKRNTAPAIALAVKYLLEKNIQKDEILGIFPSDHYIGNLESFSNCLHRAEEFARHGHIVTLGILPKKPETNYGYIEIGKLLRDNVYEVSKFHEKPSLETATEYFSKGTFFWNSGMFFFSVGTILEEFEAYLPEIYDIIVRENYSGFIEKFGEFPSLPIDRAIMEKTKKAVVIPCEFEWSDLGTWDSVFELAERIELSDESPLFDIIRKMKRLEDSS